MRGIVHGLRCVGIVGEMRFLNKTVEKSIKTPFLGAMSASLRLQMGRWDKPRFTVTHFAVGCSRAGTTNGHARPDMSKTLSPEELDLDEDAIRSNRAKRVHFFNTVQIPALRLLGKTMLAIVVWLYLHFVPGLSNIDWICYALVAYALIS
jgi:hypothetical protein